MNSYNCSCALHAIFLYIFPVIIPVLVHSAISSFPVLVNLSTSQYLNGAQVLSTSPSVLFEFMLIKLCKLQPQLQLTLRNSRRCSAQNPSPPESHRTRDFHFSVSSPSMAMNRLSPLKFPLKCENSSVLVHRPLLRRKKLGPNKPISSSILD